MGETWVRSLYWEDPLEKGLANQSGILWLPCGSAGKESACNAGDLGSIPGLGRSPGEVKDYPLQYSALEKPMGCIVHGLQRVGHDRATFTFTFTRWQTFGLYGLKTGDYCKSSSYFSIHDKAASTSVPDFLRISQRIF